MRAIHTHVYVRRQTQYNTVHKFISGIFFRNALLFISIRFVAQPKLIVGLSRACTVAHIVCCAASVAHMVWMPLNLEILPNWNRMEFLWYVQCLLWLISENNNHTKGFWHIYGLALSFYTSKLDLLGSFSLVKRFNGNMDEFFWHLGNTSIRYFAGVYRHFAKASHVFDSQTI